MVATFLFLTLKLGFKGRVGFAVAAWSLCLKAPLHAVGGGERCCGPPGLSLSSIAEQLSLTGRPAATMFPNKGLHLL